MRILKDRLAFIEALICWTVTTVVGVRIIIDVIKWSGFVKWASLGNTHLWQGLGVFVIFHSTVCGLSFLYRRIFPQLSLVFIYLNLQLLFYLLFLIKGLIFVNLTDQSWWSIIFFFLVILRVILPGQKPEVGTFRKDIPLFGKTLIGIWFLSSVCLWIPQDWDINRKAFVDEGLFWVTAGQEMIKQGIIAAHTAIYPGGWQHPFGVPFMAAAPMTWGVWRDPWAIYCWPLVIIFSLGLWLFSQRLGRWALLYFMAALLVVFGNEFWPSQLMYQLVYGESIGVILLLVFFSEIWRCLRLSTLFPATIFAISGAIGLLALTKAPGDLLVIPLEATFLFLLFRYHRSMINGRILFGSIAGSLFPLLIWRIFDQHFHVLAISTPGQFLDMIARIPHPNTALLSLAIKSMWGLNQNMVYVTCFSLVILGAGDSRMRSLMAPVFVWVMAWLFYYAYIYHYHNAPGDYFSGLRYLMPTTLVLFWAAASIYQDTIDQRLMKKRGVVYLLQCLPIIFIVMILFFRKLYMFDAQGCPIAVF
ncbi:MAG: hypothetical protein HQL14_08055 [Candidatus Omnitrophica bacterium]|nr:hypothetical protein [Candidatus Omnitrophota bacterium]